MDEEGEDGGGARNEEGGGMRRGRMGEGREEEGEDG